MNNKIDIVNRISIGIDTASDEKNENLLNKFIEEINIFLSSSDFDSSLKQILYYDLGNAYSSLDSLKNRNENNVWNYNNIEHLNAIKAYRNCVKIETKNYPNKNDILVQCYTNLGNMFSESGRIIYAISAWKKALSINSAFGMAQGNLGRGLVEYAKNLYDDGQAFLIAKYAYECLKKSIISNDVYPSAKNYFESYKQFLVRTISIENLEAKEDFKDYFSSLALKEKNYRLWVLSKSLFLNPLNDIYYDTYVAHDIIHLPNMITSINEPPIYHGLFNEIKQQYVSARYFYYLYLQKKDTLEKHFADKENLLVNTLDYSLYGIEYELLKTAYKSLYSILDKIAFFINRYFKLNKELKSVSFNTIWYDKKSIDKKVEGLKNNPLRGLYYLSKDFHSYDMEYLEVSDDDAKNLAELRNCLEHRYVKITQFENSPDISFQYDSFAYQITENDFEKKTEKILFYVREAIIYLSLAVHINERLNQPIDGKIIPIIMGATL